MLSVETEYVWRTTAGNGGVLGVDGVEDDDVRVRVRLLGRLTVAGVRRRVGVLKRPDSACMVRRGVASLLVVLSVDIREPLGNDVKVPSKGLGEDLRRVGRWIVSFKSISRKEWLTLDNFSLVSRPHAFSKHGRGRSLCVIPRAPRRAETWSALRFTFTPRGALGPLNQPQTADIWLVQGQSLSVLSDHLVAMQSFMNLPVSSRLSSWTTSFVHWPTVREFNISSSRLSRRDRCIHTLTTLHMALSYQQRTICLIKSGGMDNPDVFVIAGGFVAERGGAEEVELGCEWHSCVSVELEHNYTHSRCMDSKGAPCQKRPGMAGVPPVQR